MSSPAAFSPSALRATDSPPPSVAPQLCQSAADGAGGAGLAGGLGVTPGLPPGEAGRADWDGAGGAAAGAVDAQAAVMSTASRPADCWRRRTCTPRPGMPGCP